MDCFRSGCCFEELWDHLLNKVYVLGIFHNHLQRVQRQNHFILSITARMLGIKRVVIALEYTHVNSVSANISRSTIDDPYQLTLLPITHMLSVKMLNYTSP